MEEVGVRLHFEGKLIRLGDEVIDKENGNQCGGKWRLVFRKQWNQGEWKTTRQRNSKASSNKNKKTNVISGWAKTFSMMTMLEQMKETRSWKAVRGSVQDRRCRVCHKRDESIEHLVAGCKVLGNSNYLSRHNRAIMIMAVAWPKEYELADGDMVCKKNGGNKEQWGKRVWDFEVHLHKTTMTRRPNLS